MTVTRYSTWSITVDDKAKAFDVTTAPGHPIELEAVPRTFTPQLAGELAQALSEAATVSAGTAAKVSPPHPDETVVDPTATAVGGSTHRVPAGRPPDSSRAASAPAASPPTGGTAPPRAPASGQ